MNIKIWQAKIGHITLYLLDTDLDTNSQHDRNITHRLYGGDKVMRIEQEIVLGIGGVRALQELGLKPTVWHINEGHAAFMVLERISQKIKTDSLDFAAALENVAVNTIFTTHTPVPAGHDHFSQEMMGSYFEKYYPELKLTRQDFLALGHSQDSPEFNMTALAIRGTRFNNGVSRIHGDVSAVGTEAAGLAEPDLDARVRGRRPSRLSRPPSALGSRPQTLFLPLGPSSRRRP